MRHTKPTICYIDDDQTEATDFYGEMEDYFDIIEVIVKERESIEDLIARIKAYEIQYLVVDYHLNQNISLDYDGDAVIAKYTSEFKNFPCMLLSSDGKGAITQSEAISPDIVRDKSEVFDTQRKGKDLVILQIEKSINDYEKRLSEAEAAYKQLLYKRDHEGLTYEEEKIAGELDELIDKSLDNTSPVVPIDITNGTRIAELINQTDELIKKIKNHG